MSIRFFKDMLERAWQAAAAVLLATIPADVSNIVSVGFWRDGWKLAAGTIVASMLMSIVASRRGDEHTASFQLPAEPDEHVGAE